MLEIAHGSRRIRRSLQGMHQLHREQLLQCTWQQVVCSRSPANLHQHEDDVHSCAAAISARQQRRPAAAMCPAALPSKAGRYTVRMAQSIGARDAADRQDGHRLIVAAARTCAVHRRGGAARSEKFCVRAPSGRKFWSFWSHSRRLLRAATPTKSIELSRMAGCPRPGSRRNRSNSQLHGKKFGPQRFSDANRLHRGIVWS